MPAPTRSRRASPGWATAVWTQGERFGTIGAKFGDRVYEITTFRAESYTDDSRKPHVTYADDDRDRSRPARLHRQRDGARAHRWRHADPRRPARRRRRPDPEGAADPARPGRQLQRRPAPHVARGPFRRPLRPAAHRRAGRRGRGDGDAARDRVGRTDPRRVRQADHGRSPGERALVPVRHRARAISSSRSCRRCGSSTTRSTGTRTCCRTRSPSSRTSGRRTNSRRDGRRSTSGIVRLAALFHDIGKPRTRGYLEGKGTTFHHHDAVGARMTKQAHDRAALLERRRRRRDDARRAPPALPHLPAGLVGLGRASLRA